MKYILKKAEISSEGGFIGEGKLSPVNKSKDSWIMKQIIKKKFIPGIKRTRDKNGILKFSSELFPKNLKPIMDSMILPFSNIEKNYSIVKHSKSLCIRLAWEISILSEDEFLDIKDVEMYSKMVYNSAIEDIENFMITPIKFEGVYDLENKKFSVCATAIIPIEFTQYFKDELEKRGF